MSLFVNGAPLDISHLAPFQRKVPAILRGGHSKVLPVHWTFSGHCYTRKKTDEDILLEGAWYEDGSVHLSRPRVYCAIRYKLSLVLPQRIDEMILHDEEVHCSNKGNYFIFKIPDQLSECIFDDYLIFMSAKKVVEPNVQKHIKILVESAYPKSAAKDLPKAVQSSPFSCVLAKIWAQ